MRSLFSSLRFAVAAAVDALGAVGQDKLLRQLLLDGGDAARVLALEHAHDALGHVILKEFTVCCI